MKYSLDPGCLRLLAECLAGRCPLAVLADELDERHDQRAARVRAAPLRGDEPGDVEALAVALFKRRTGRRPARTLSGPLVHRCLMRAKGLLSEDARFRLPPAAAEADELRSLFRRRLAKALGSGSEEAGFLLMRVAEADESSSATEARAVREG